MPVFVRMTGVGINVGNDPVIRDLAGNSSPPISAIRTLRGFHVLPGD